MAAVTRSRSAYSEKVSNEQVVNRATLTIELNVAGAKPSIKDLNIDLALSKRTCVKPYDGQDAFDNLPPDDCCFRKARAHDENVDAQILSAERIFNISNEVPAVVSNMLKWMARARYSPRQAFVENKDLDVGYFVRRSARQAQVVI